MPKIQAKELHSGSPAAHLVVVGGDISILGCLEEGVGGLRLARKLGASWRELGVWNFQRPVLVTESQRDDSSPTEAGKSLTSSSAWRLGEVPRTGRDLPGALLAWRNEAQAPCLSYLKHHPFCR